MILPLADSGDCRPMILVILILMIVAIVVVIVAIVAIVAGHSFAQE